MAEASGGAFGEIEGSEGGLDRLSTMDGKNVYGWDMPLVNFPICFVNTKISIFMYRLGISTME